MGHKITTIKLAHIAPKIIAYVADAHTAGMKDNIMDIIIGFLVALLFVVMGFRIVMDIVGFIFKNTWSIITVILVVLAVLLILNS
jgi:hypothetical protein